MRYAFMIALAALLSGMTLAQEPTTRPSATQPRRSAEELARELRKDAAQRRAERQRLREDTRALHERLARLQARVLLDRGASFLLAAQDGSGGWAPETGPGITCLALKALAQHPDVGPKHPAVRRGIEFLRRFQRDDGGLYSAEGLIKNYESSVALSMFAVFPDDEHEQTVQQLQSFLKELQWDQGEGKSPDDPWYGGAGYGRQKRPDLSNTQMMLDALHESGLPKDDPAYQKALVFIQRCQMLGETNDMPFAEGSSQGGFIYTAANDGESKAGKTEVDDRKELRCYGSMTYAGLKSMVYAGLKRDDPRVKAALDWVKRHWTLDQNPNMPPAQAKQGLFYYYHTFAKALEAWGEPVVTDNAGRDHHWRRELTDKLAELQKEDGSWVNEADRWFEGVPALTTAYSMLALQEAFPPE